MPMAWVRAWSAGTGLLLAGLFAGVAFAQGGLPLTMGSPVAPSSPIVTLDPERLYSESLFGRRVARESEAASAALLAENREIQTALKAEETALTRRRPTLSPAEFRALADDFDARVVRARNEQDDKARALQRRAELERQTFLLRVPPILADVMAQRGAVAILDGRSVFLTAEGIDITNVALLRVNEVLGDGSSLGPLPLIAPDRGGTDTEPQPLDPGSGTLPLPGTAPLP